MNGERLHDRCGKREGDYMMDSYGISLYFGDKIYTYIYGVDQGLDCLIISYTILAIITTLFAYCLHRTMIIGWWWILWFPVSSNTRNCSTSLCMRCSVNQWKSINQDRYYAKSPQERSFWSVCGSKRRTIRGKFNAPTPIRAPDCHILLNVQEIFLP